MANITVNTECVYRCNITMWFWSENLFVTAILFPTKHHTSKHSIPCCLTFAFILRNFYTLWHKSKIIIRYIVKQGSTTLTKPPLFFSPSLSSVGNSRMALKITKKSPLMWFLHLKCIKIFCARGSAPNAILKKELQHLTKSLPGLTASWLRRWSRTLLLDSLPMGLLIIRRVISQFCSPAYNLKTVKDIFSILTTLN